MRYLALAVLFIANHLALAQKKVFEETPAATVSRVAQRVISHTPFYYKLTTPKANPTFDFIKSVNLGRCLEASKPGQIAYLYTELVAARDTQIVLEASYGGNLKVQLNGEEVFRDDKDQAFAYQQKEREFQLSKSFAVKLRAGVNTLLIKARRGNGEWKVFLQPKGGLIEFSLVKGLELGLHRNKQVDPELARQITFLVAGPFTAGSIDENFWPERDNTLATPQYHNGQLMTWEAPKLELFADLIDAHPLWGTFYSYNYHAAGLAWAMANLGTYTGNKAFIDHSNRYTDYMLYSRPLVRYQVLGLDGFRSAQHHMVNTPLLDFTTAPSLPFVQRLINEASFGNRKMYEGLVDTIATYALTKQVRLPDGTFTRETPERFTTWVDDMFMGIPFLVYASKAEKDPTRKQRLLDEAARQVLGFEKNVFDRKADLFHHAQYSTRKADIPHWSRANGWGIFATSIVLQSLPKNHPSYKAILNLFQRHAAAILKYQNEKTGMYHQVIDDPSSYLETSATGIFTMAFARGVNEGWLPAKFRKAAIKGWEGILTQIEPDGTVHGICVGTMSSETSTYYKERPVADNDSHGLLGLMWTGIEMDKMLKSKAN